MARSWARSTDQTKPNMLLQLTLRRRALLRRTRRHSAAESMFDKGERQLIELLWELWQHRRISDSESAAAAAKTTSHDAIARIEELEYTTEKLLLLSRALWEIIQERDGVDDETLLAKVRDIDMRDGRLDGRLARPLVVKCPKCANALNKKHRRCIYCGEAVDPNADPFS